MCGEIPRVDLRRVSTWHGRVMLDLELLFLLAVKATGSDEFFSRLPGFKQVLNPEQKIQRPIIHCCNQSLTPACV